MLNRLSQCKLFYDSVINAEIHKLQYSVWILQKQNLSFVTSSRHFSRCNCCSYCRFFFCFKTAGSTGACMSTPVPIICPYLCHSLLSKSLAPLQNNPPPGALKAKIYTNSLAVLSREWAAFRQGKFVYVCNSACFKIKLSVQTLSLSCVRNSGDNNTYPRK